MKRIIVRTVLAAVVTFAGLTGTTHAGDGHPPSTDPTDSIPPETDPPTTTTIPLTASISVDAGCDRIVVHVSTTSTRPVQVDVIIGAEQQIRWATGDTTITVDYLPADPRPWRVRVPLFRIDQTGMTASCPPPTTVPATTTTTIPAPTTTVCVSTATGLPIPCDPPACDAPAPACTTTTPVETTTTTTVVATGPAPTQPPTAGPTQLPTTGTGSTSVILAAGALLVALGLAARRVRTS